MRIRTPLFVGMSLSLFVACHSKKDKLAAEHGVAPPPIQSSKPGACLGGGGTVSDKVSAAFFPRTVAGYCIDPNGETRTYGASAKEGLDKVCTELFDGECEVYKSYGLKRVVTLRYIDGKGSPGTVTVNLSRFGSRDGAFGFYTKRVVADSDPAENAPSKLHAGGAAALGTGIAYVWRGEYVAEISYVNENEAPDQVKKSSDSLLPSFAKQLGDKLPGDKSLPPAAFALPSADRVSQGIAYDAKDVLGIKGAGPGAEGFYKNGDKRWRDFVIVRPDEASAKDVMKTLRKLDGAKTLKKQLYDMVTFARRADESSPRIEWMAGRKGARVFGVGDEEYALDSGQSAEDAKKVSLDKDQKLARLKQLIDTAGGK
jgi:hypothetical protein